MKKISELRPVAAGFFLAVVCLNAVGCKDTLELKKQHGEVLAQTEILRGQSADLDVKLADLRKAMPTASTPMGAAETMAKTHQKELKSIADERAIVNTRIKAQEERVAVVQKEIAEFKALGQTQTQPQSSTNPPKS